MSSYGELVDSSTVRFERLLPGPIERDWRYVTEGDKRATWLAGGDMELEVDGMVELHFHNSSLSTQPDIEPPEKYRNMPEHVSFSGKVTRCEPPRILSHTWELDSERSEVCYELEEQGDKVRLVLTHRRLQSTEKVTSFCGGWHTHLDILNDVLHGREPSPFWKAYTTLEAEYERRSQSSR